MKVPWTNRPEFIACYYFPVLIDGDRWAAIMLLYGGRGRIITGKVSDTDSYDHGY